MAVDTEGVRTRAEGARTCADESTRLTSERARRGGASSVLRAFRSTKNECGVTSPKAIEQLREAARAHPRTSKDANGDGREIRRRVTPPVRRPRHVQRNLSSPRTQCSRPERLRRLGWPAGGVRERRTRHAGHRQETGFHPDRTADEGCNVEKRHRRNQGRSRGAEE